MNKPDIRILYNIIYNEDCFETFKRIYNDSIDSVVTDPPYELGFMSKAWDKTGIAYNVKMWHEVLRVLKPGGHLLSFGGTRTSHRMACAIEDAGFEIRDTVMWVYGQGFPKSLDISKAIDKGAGAQRDIIGISPNSRYNSNKMYANGNGLRGHESYIGDPITTPFTPEAKQWEGWGTGLKPAFEPIILARKPISEKTIADNVLKWGTGAINIDASRIPLNGDITGRKPYADSDAIFSPGKTIGSMNDNWKQGRFPSNLIHDGSDEVLAEFAKAGNRKTGYIKSGTYHNRAKFINVAYGEFKGNENYDPIHNGDTGTAARFFYCAKASRSERDAGLEGMNKGEAQSRYGLGDSGGIRAPHENKPQVNNHPTVKPLALMRYLIKLITPPNGIILDPFCGSGSTLIAAKQLNYNYIGCELDKNYYDICMKRIEEYTQKLLF